VLDKRVLSPFSNLLPRQDLLSVLIQEFSLQTHGLTDSLHSSPLFGDWNSLSPTDLPFGAKLWSEPKNLFGSNAFFFHGLTRGSAPVRQAMNRERPARKGGGCVRE